MNGKSSGRRRDAVILIGRAGYDLDRSDVLDRRRLFRPRQTAVDAVFDNGALGVVHRRHDGVSHSVVYTLVRRDLYLEKILESGFEEHDSPSVGIRGRAGGQSDDFFRALSGVFVKIPYVKTLRGTAQIVKKSVDRSVRIRAHYNVVVSVRIDCREELKVVKARGSDENTVFVRLRVFGVGVFVESAEHRAVCHVVAVDKIVCVAEIGRIVAVKVDRTGQTRFSVDVVRRVVQIVGPLHNGVVDIRFVKRQPGAVILVYRG